MSGNTFVAYEINNELSPDIPPTTEAAYCPIASPVLSHI